jgi:hypothetical protein
MKNLKGLSLKSHEWNNQPQKPNGVQLQVCEHQAPMNSCMHDDLAEQHPVYAVRLHHLSQDVREVLRDGPGHLLLAVSSPELPPPLWQRLLG